MLHIILLHCNHHPPPPQLHTPNHISLTHICHSLVQVDLWQTDHPAHGLNGSRTIDSVVDYEEWKFEQQVLSIINSHDPSTPLFLNYDPHLIHEPLEVPEVYYNKVGVFSQSYLILS